MSTCVKCGSPLEQGQAFCTKCGASTTVASASQASQFCTSCGCALRSGTKFCEKCGAPSTPTKTAHTSLPSNSPAERRDVTPNNAIPPGAAPTQTGSKLLKFFMIAAALVALFLVAVMGSCAYVAYRAKQRIDKVQQAYKKDDLGGMIAAATGQTSKPQPLPQWMPASPELVSSPTSKIPLRKTLRLVNAGTDELRGDFESIFAVDDVTDQFVHIHAAEQFPPGQGIARFLGGSSSSSQKPQEIVCGRIVFVTDMENSSETNGYLCRDKREEKFPGTTAISLSRKTVNELRTAGQSEFTYHEDPLKSVLKSFKTAMAAQDEKSSDAASQDLMKKMMSFAPGGGISPDISMDTPPQKCTLHRNGNDVAFPVLVNDQKTELPVIDVVVKLPNKEGHMYVLDDPENPLVLGSASTEGGHEQVIKIYWDKEKTSTPNQLEQDLEKNGRAKVYDLYFDFASASLRPESNKVLKEIADVMRAHPDWKLSVEGHTDNIGGNTSNLELSKRRTEAVVHVLAANYDIPASRFTTDGFGASRPVDTNDTLEGRARNRRVELVRQ